MNSLVTERDVRPGDLQREHRVETNMFGAGLDYWLMVNLRQKLRGCAGDTTKLDVREKFGEVVMIDVRIPTNDGRSLEMRWGRQYEREHRIILDMLKMDLPKQPQPKVYRHQLHDLCCGGN
jgi:hypothetical protein